jgi:hypothetical protein
MRTDRPQTDILRMLRPSRLAPVLLPASATASLARDLAIAKPEHCTGNRGRNEAGLSPTCQSREAPTHPD